MDLTTCIKRDRATREFTDEQVAEGDIRAVIDAARRSGSGKNRQPWSFVVVQDPERRADLAALGKYATPLREAPVAIVLLMDVRDEEVDLNYDVFDCGRAFQNLKLASRDRGLGSVPQGIHREKAATLLEVPESKTVLIALALGHPADGDDTIEGEDKSAVLEDMGRGSLDELLHWETHA